MYSRWRRKMRQDDYWRFPLATGEASLRGTTTTLSAGVGWLWLWGCVMDCCDGCAASAGHAAKGLGLCEVSDSGLATLTVVPLLVSCLPVTQPPGPSQQPTESTVPEIHPGRTRPAPRATGRLFASRCCGRSCPLSRQSDSRCARGLRRRARRSPRAFERPLGEWRGLRATGFGADRGTTEGANQADDGKEASESVWFGDSDGLEARVRTVGSESAPQDVRIVTLSSPKTSGDRSAISSATMTAAVADAPTPQIFSRGHWGADESLRTGKPGCGQPTYSSTVKVAFVHHTATANGYTPEDVVPTDPQHLHI